MKIQYIKSLCKQAQNHTDVTVQDSTQFKLSQFMRYPIYNDLVHANSEHLSTIQYVFSLQLKRFSQLHFVCEKYFYYR